MPRLLLGLLLSISCVTVQAAELGPAETLFDGKTFTHWQGKLSSWRIEDGCFVGGTLKEKIPNNEFLTFDREFADFELRLKFKVLGEKVNAGIQIRSQRIPNHHEMIGYQADLGDGWWGSLYDESRRRVTLAKPQPEVIEKCVRRGEWNEYVIRCEGPRVQLFINDTQTVDYTETDKSLVQRGLIGLQIHSGPPSEAWYKDITIRELR